MAGQFSPTARPARPGAYFNFQALTPQPVFVNTEGIVALQITHNWGPENQVLECFSFSDFLKYYGDGGAGLASPTFTPGYKAVRMAFQGEGIPGRGGAGEVRVYRAVGSSGAASHVALQNTTPVDAITLTAVYKGSYGDKISVSVVANARNPSTQADLSVYVQGFLTEVFTYAKTDITKLASLINDKYHGSKWIVASGVTSGVALTTVTTPTNLASGNDGASLVGQDFTDVLAAFNTVRFGIFAVQDIAATASWADDTGSTVLTAILTWQETLNLKGKRFMTVIGGSSADTATSAGGRSALGGVNEQGDPNVVNIGVGTYTDSTLGLLTTSQLAPRLAGIIAARTEKQGLSFARLAGVTITDGASDSDITSSLTNGFMTLSRDSNALAPVRFEKGVTTFTVPDESRPLWAYSNPKFVLTMQHIENEFTEWAESNVIGRLPVDDNAVQYVLGNLKARMKAREADEIVQPGWTVVRDPGFAPTPQDDFIRVLYGLTFIRDMEQVLNTVVVA